MSRFLVDARKGADGSCSRESLKYIVSEILDNGGRGALVEACNEAERKYD